MHVRTLKRGTGLAAAGVASLVSVSVPVVGLAGAAGASTSHLAASKGSDPGSAFCQFGRKEAKSTTAVETKEETALEAGNWPAAQKIILSTFSSLNAIIKSDGAALGAVPSKVKAAIEVSLKAIPAEEKAVRSSTSVSQFESSVNALFTTKKMTSAVKVVDAYQTATCGSLTATT